MFGFPKASDNLPVSVHFQVENGREHWTRKFGEEILSTTLRAGRDASERLLCERVGLFDFAQALVVDGDKLRLVLRRWTVFGIPLPSWLAPRSDSYETEQDGKFRFHVEISHPLLGLIVRYRGWLVGDNGSPGMEHQHCPHNDLAIQIDVSDAGAAPTKQ
jgi:hypothetical protein